MTNPAEYDLFRNDPPIPPVGTKGGRSAPFHPTPWVAHPADGADLIDGTDMWFFNDANGEEVFYGHAMSIEVRDLVLAAVNRTHSKANEG